jgi:hypothetical protein
MRWVWLVLVGCSGAPARDPTTEWRPPSEPVGGERPAVRAGAPADARLPDADPDPDPDHDRIVGACDLCPNDPETYNGIVDEDGCPDSSGLSHAVMLDPTNRFTYPATIWFDGAKPRDLEDLQIDHSDAWIDGGIEVVDVIGRSTVDVSPALAAKRVAIVVKHLRLQLSRLALGVRIEEHVTAASSLYVDEDGPRDAPASVDVQVMRARGIEVWRWEDDHLVRATPRRRLPVPKLPPGCP